MGIDHGGMQIRVPHELLHGSDILPALKPMGHERTAKRVATCGFAEAGAPNGLLHSLLDLTRIQVVASLLGRGRILRQGVAQLDELRAIPAYAGRTSDRERDQFCEYGPSPRVRGEPSAGSEAGVPIAGHPRVCGENCSRRPLGCVLIRAIPACAGRTQFRATPRSPASGHPRVCGENLCKLPPPVWR